MTIKSIKELIVAVGLGVHLTVFYIILKMTGIIEWDWLWILSPLWFPLSIIFVFVFGSFLISLVEEIGEAK